jgi:F-type H+-transporting ATPase subunit gamma
MAAIIEIKNRIKAVKNIGQITKAMEVVAATKMRKSQEVALGSRPYAFKAMHLLSILAEFGTVKTKLMSVRPVKKTLLVVISSDRGLAGSFNSQVFKAAENFINNFNKDAGELKLIAVGKKAISFVNKRKLPVFAEYKDFGDFIEPAETESLSKTITEGFLSGDWDRVITISTHFRTTLKQEVLQRQLLPLDLERIRRTITEIVPEHGKYSEMRGELLDYGKKRLEYKFEPTSEELIENLVKHLLAMEVYHVVLEANASEHSARMVAMKTASDNAKELSGDLSLEFNKVRQGGITKEIMEITSGINTIQ